MLKEFKSFVDKHNLIAKDDRVLLALSGGVDSMVLAKLLLLSQQTTDNGQQSDFKVQSPKSKVQYLSLIVTSICVAMTLIVMRNSLQTSRKKTIYLFL